MRNLIVGATAAAAAAASVIWWRERSQSPQPPAQTQPAAGKREQNLQQLLEYCRRHAPVRNRDIVSLLGVSPKTARNYCNELERRGQIVQRGETGRDVYYTAA